jgi:ribose transport system substrate-binding protein
MKKLNKTLALLIVLIFVANVLAACATPATPEAVATEAPEVEEPAPEEPAAEETEEAAPAEPAGDGAPYTIGISNPFITSEYRTQMIERLEETNAEYMEMGLTTELVIESENTDVAGQLQQIENLMNQGVDAILVNPGDAVALNQILEEAVQQGIIVISIDQEIEAEGVVNVGHDQKEWAKTSAAWFAEELQEGDVVLIEGFIGHPANEYRMSGVYEVFEDYPGINVLASETGSWDEATGQQVMADFLAAYPDLDGYWTQDGMAIGALEAVKAAGLDEYPLGVGEGRVKFLKLWKEALEADPNFKSFAVANAPGVAASGLRIAVELLEGKELKPEALSGQFGTTVVVPIPVVVNPDNFEEIYTEYVDGGFPDSWLLDGIMTIEEVQSLFVGGPDMMVEEPEPEEPMMVEGAPFTIGISNPFITSEYRTQMIERLEETNAEYMEMGLTEALVIESENTDVAGQLQQIENLMNQGVDALLVNPGDAVALNQILEEAVQQGIIVISIDQEIEAEGVVNVGHDQKEWAKTSAAWFAEELQEGDVVLIEGFIGHPANEYRMSGVYEVFEDYPGINVLASETGSWDEATGQQVMADFLAAYPDLDGYWTQDGMAIGALEAVKAAGLDEYPLGVGEGRVKFLKLWKEALDADPEFKSFAVANAPGVAATGLRIAVELLSGKELKAESLSGQFGTTVIVPIPVVVNPDNFEEIYAEYVDGGFPDSWLLDGIMTIEEVQALFE